MRVSMCPIRLLPAFLLVPAACSLDVGADVDELMFAQMGAAGMRPEPTQATGNATASFSIAGTRIHYDLNLFGVTGATGATLHIGGTAVSSPPIATLYSSPNPQGTTGTGLVVSGAALRGGDLSGGITVDSLLSAIRAGNAYVQLTTTAFPQGAMRGQILPFGADPPPELLSAEMNGANERPTPVNTPATGEAHFAYATDAVRFHLIVSNITAVTAAHIHEGTADEPGPIIVTLFAPPEPTGAVSGTLASGVFTTTDTGMILDDLVLLMRIGHAYVNVHTTENPGGEIRGQTVPVNSTPPFP